MNRFFLFVWLDWCMSFSSLINPFWSLDALIFFAFPLSRWKVFMSPWIGESLLWKVWNKLKPHNMWKEQSRSFVEKIFFLNMQSVLSVMFFWFSPHDKKIIIAELFCASLFKWWWYTQPVDMPYLTYSVFLWWMNRWLHLKFKFKRMQTVYDLLLLLFLFSVLGLLVVPCLWNLTIVLQL